MSEQDSSEIAWPTLDPRTLTELEELGEIREVAAGVERFGPSG